MSRWKQELTGRIEIAVDTVCAGEGEYVLLTRGSSARHIFEDDKGTAVGVLLWVLLIVLKK